MEMPSFDYSNVSPTGESNATAGGTSESHGRAIESASASTEVQTNSSNTAYVITGVTLGVITLLALAFTMLMYAVMTTAFSSSYSYEVIPEDMHDGWEHGLSDDDIAWLEDQLISEM